MGNLSLDETQRLNDTLDRLLSAIATDTLDYLTDDSIDITSLWYIAETLFDARPSDHPKSSRQLVSPVKFFIQHYGEQLVSQFNELTKLRTSLSLSTESNSSTPHLSVVRGNRLTFTLTNADRTQVTVTLSSEQNTAKVLMELAKNAQIKVPTIHLAKVLGAHNPNEFDEKKRVRNAIKDIRDHFRCRSGSKNDIIEGGDRGYLLKCQVTLS